MIGAYQDPSMCSVHIFTASLSDRLTIAPYHSYSGVEPMKEKGQLES